MCPPERQTLLFSATISAEVAELANASLREPLQALPLSAPRFSPPLSASPARPLPFRLPSLPRTCQRAETCPRPRDVPPPYPPQVKVDALYGVAERLAQEFVRIKPGKEHEREAFLPSLAPSPRSPPPLARPRALAVTLAVTLAARRVSSHAPAADRRSSSRSRAAPSPRAPSSSSRQRQRRTGCASSSGSRSCARRSCTAT